MTFLIATICLFASLAAQADSLTCFSQGFGLGGTGSPIPNGRSFGSNQSWAPDVAGTPYFTGGTWSGYSYNSVSGIVGGSNRHVFEGKNQSNANTPTTCFTPVFGGHTYPCDSSHLPEVVVPDACGFLYNPPPYTPRGFGRPDKYAPFNHNGTWGSPSVPAVDLGTVKLFSLATDFVGSQTPPFTNSQDNVVAQVANTAYNRAISKGSLLAIHGAHSGWKMVAFRKVTSSIDVTIQHSDPQDPFPLENNTLNGGQFIWLDNCGAREGDSGARLYVHLLDASGNACWQPAGIVTYASPPPVGDDSCIAESEKFNVLPAIDAAYGTSGTQPVGNCTPAGPKTAAGNWDTNNFLWYIQTAIDAMDSAWDKFTSFLSSNCDGANGHCGNDNWTNIIRNVSLPSLPSGAHLMNPGFADNGSDTTTEILNVDLFCRHGDCQSGGSIPASQIASYVTGQVLGATNSVGYSVQSALQSFGLPTTVTVNINVAKPIEMNEQAVPSEPVIQYYTGTLPNYVGGSQFETVFGLAFNLIPDQVTGTLYTRVGNKDCAEMIAGSPYTTDIRYSGGRIIATFHAALTITAIQWGVNQGNTINPPSYCGTTAHVGDVLTLDGVGTCATSDVHEFCNQQFQITGNGSNGNLMRVHSQYLGGSASPVANMSFIDPGTQIPAVIDTWWDSSRRCLNGTCNQYPLLFSAYDPCCGGIYHMGAYVIANNIDPYVVPGKETTADANIGTVAGYEGWGIQESYVNFLDSGFSVGYPVTSATLAFGVLASPGLGVFGGLGGFGGY